MTLRGQALVWLAVALPMFLSIGGLAIDGALLLSARHELQSVADGAARAGATRLDLDLLRASGGAQVQLDSPRAYAAASTYLRDGLARDLAWSAPPDTHVDVRDQRVQVSIQGNLQTAFLRIVRLETLPVGATAVANAQFGIRGPTLNHVDLSSR